MLPTLLAGGKKNYTTILWLNILLGWTLAGWISVLMWALANDDKPGPGTATPPLRRDIDSRKALVARLQQLRDEGILTQEEFMKHLRGIK
ncbi:superinfection immunity protein [uncultured Hymenobacter sp.]|uniref:superinfection immunity protein n=1 Tax=uncultured Hymenobacter sp. TaxID=170016 RepID=UPI0035C98697